MLPANTAFANADTRFEGRVVDMALTDVLSVLGREFGIQFLGPRADRSRVRDLPLSGGPDEVISAVMRAAEMDAFRFNGQVYYAPVSERAVRLIPLDDGISAASARTALAEAGLVFQDYSITDVAGGSAIAISGPIQYLALSEGVIGAMTAVPDAPSETVRVRRGGMLETDLSPALGTVSTQSSN